MIEFKELSEQTPEDGRSCILKFENDCYGIGEYSLEDGFRPINVWSRGGEEVSFEFPVKLWHYTEVLEV